MGRAPCCDKANVKRGPWSPEEDAKLKAYIEQHGTGGNWMALPQKIGLKRCGKSCRLRWLNYLRPNIKRGGFTVEEENIICSLYFNIGSRWSVIAAQLPGRTDNDIKNYWNTRLKKKLLGKQQRKQNQEDEEEEARRSMSFEKAQEIKRQSHGNSPYYKPEAAELLVMNNHHNDVDDRPAFIRNLLIKLGGRFSNDNPHQQPITNSLLHPPIQMFTPQNQLYANSSSTPCFSTCSDYSVSLHPEAGPHDHNDLFVQEIENLTVDDQFQLDEFPLQLDDLESWLFGMEMVMSTTTGTPSTECSLNTWGDVMMSN